MKIITITAAKGGVGKTTISRNLAAYLAQHGSKVLLFDLDESCNLSHDFNIYQTENNVSELFQPLGNDVKIPTIHHVADNIDLVGGDLLLDTYQNKILTDPSQNQRLLTYLRVLINQHAFDYDYVIFDCHQNFNVATCNAILCSHAILSPLTPDENGFNAKFDVVNRLESYRLHGDKDTLTNESLIKAKLFFVGNRIAMNRKLSRNLLDVIQDDKQILSYVPEREAFKHATLAKQDIFTYLNSKDNLTASDRKFIQQVEDTFALIKDAIDHQTSANLIDTLIQNA